MKPISVSLSVALVLLSALKAFPAQLSGQVFIVTAGHESKKLALVEVSAFNEKAVMDAIGSTREKTKPDVDKMKKFVSAAAKFPEAMTKIQDHAFELVLHQQIPDARWNESKDIELEAIRLHSAAASHLSYLLSSQRFFEDLPSPIATTKTDADGNFEIRVPDGEPSIIGASATRSVVDNVESYHWLVRIENPREKLMLSNDNLTSSGGSVLVATEGGRDVGSIGTLEKQLRELIAKSQNFATRLQGDGSAKSPQAAPQTLAEFATLTKPIDVPLKYGSAKLPVGIKLKVLSRTNSAAFVDYGGEKIQIPIEATDIK